MVGASTAIALLQSRCVAPICSGLSRRTCLAVPRPNERRFGRGNGDHSQHHRSAKYFHGIAAYADVGNALAFPGCSDIHLAWATALEPLANQRLLITLCGLVLDHPTGGAAGRRSCGRVFAAVKKHS